MKKIYIAGLALLALSACKPNINNVMPQQGNADFSTYVSIGNSLTAGFADGTLYRSGQLNSYPSMLAEQFKSVGGGNFKQPLLPGNAGWPGVKRILGYATDCAGTTSLGPVLYSGSTDTTGSAVSVASQGPYNNVGIPGVRCIDYLYPGYGALNPYAARFFSSFTSTPLQEALKINATFYSVWLGSNDVLSYASSGGSGTVGGTGSTDISPTSLFQASYNAVIGALQATGAKGVLINIPDITTIPYFTTVPAKGLAITTQAQADALSAAYAPLGISFTVGANYFIIQDAAAPGGMRKIKDGEYIILTIPQDSLKCAGWGSLKPIPKQYVLTADEVSNVKTATTAFNQVIYTAAQQYNWAYVDMNSYIKTVASGIKFNGVDLNAVFVTGGAFSLDGVHLTPRGYALAANEVLRSINQHYTSTIPYIDINKYPGVLFP